MFRRLWLLAIIATTTAAWSAPAAARPFILTGVEPTDPYPHSAFPLPEPVATDPGGGSALSIGVAARARSWPATIGENFSSPMFYDLDDDGTMEVIATDRQFTYVFDADGNILPGWPRSGGSDNIPAVADIDEDGSPEICIASPGAPPKIRCFNVDGTYQAGFPVNLPYQYWLNVSCPAIEDVDGDGHLDVGAQSEPGVAFFDRFGQPLPGWPYLWTTSQNIVWSGPAVADLDGDGLREVVVGNNNLHACKVHVIRSDGKPMPGWPRPTNNIFSSAAVGDLDGDGDLEIVIQEGDPTWYGNRMHVWHHDGTYLSGWPRAIAPQWESSRSNPAIVDVDSDGNLEIVTQTGDGMLHVLNVDGTERPGYPRLVPGGGSISSVQAIDIDLDGKEEFFLCYYTGGDQWVSGWRLDGSTLDRFPKLLFSGTQLDAHSSVHLADLEGDGDLDLCGQGQTFGAGRVWVYEVDGSTCQAQAERCDWPKIRHDTRNTGFSRRPAPTAVAEGPVQGSLLICYPNPVTPGGEISLRLPVDRLGRLSLFDLAGRRLGAIEVSGQAAAAVPISALFRTEPAAGVYFIRLEQPGEPGVQNTRLVILQ